MKPTKLFSITYYFGGKQHTYLSASIEDSLRLHYDMHSYLIDDPKPVKGFFAEILSDYDFNRLVNPS